MIGVVELYCGIGGVAAALGAVGRTVAAVDVDRGALGVYAHNFPGTTVAAAVESLPSPRMAAWDADLWWMSPPCQPYTRRGLRRGLADPRGRGFLAVLDRVATARPRYLAVENVPGFETSPARDALVATLDAAGYRAVAETLLCPSELGMPNRRRRYFLLASRDRLLPEPPRPPRRTTLAELVTPAPPPGVDAAALAVDPAVASAYAGALDVVDAADPTALTACFTAAYGRSIVRSGSYLRAGDTLRRFAPREVLRLLGFPESYRLPDGLPLRAGWRLAGNSLALAAVRHVLARVPELGPDLASA